MSSNTKTVSPWLKIEKPNETVSLASVMSEQLADHLQTQEYESLDDAEKYKIKKLI